MSLDWKHWEGNIVDGKFPLQRYLGAGTQSAVFLTQYGDPDPQPAAIKLVLADSTALNCGCRNGREPHACPIRI